MRLIAKPRRVGPAALAGLVAVSLGPADAAAPATNPFYASTPTPVAVPASASLGRPTASQRPLAGASLDGPPAEQFGAFGSTRPTAVAAWQPPAAAAWQPPAAAAWQSTPERLPTPRSVSPASVSARPASYLPTRTPHNRLAAAMDKLRTARVDLDAGAHASAESLCWEALTLAAEAVDLQIGDDAATRAVQTANTAICEAADFVGPYCDGTPVSIARIARSHRTDVVRRSFPVGVPPRPSEVPGVAVAIDRYLDVARANAAAVADQSVVAAQAIDLIAAVRLARRDARQMPDAVSLCLRRAAVQGQGGNADLVAKLGMQLADSGFADEARWALTRSLRTQPNADVAAAIAALDAGRWPTLAIEPVRRRTPQVTTVSPDQFAATSQPPGAGSPAARRPVNSGPPMTAASHPTAASTGAAPASVGRRVLSAIRWW